MSNNLRNYESLDLGYGYGKMIVTAFVGGKHGNGVQFTIGNSYCLLSEHQARDLIKTLQRRITNTQGYNATDDDMELTVYP